VDEPTPEQQPTGPTRAKLARALTMNVRRPGEKSTVFGRVVTGGLLIVLAGGLAVGIGAMAIHHNGTHPKTTNAADRQAAPKNPSRTASPPRAGAPVPIAPPGKAGTGKHGRTPAKAGAPDAGRQPAGKQGTVHTSQLAKAAAAQTAAIVSNASGKCIDVTNEGQTGVPIQIWQCSPMTAWKSWAFYSDGTIRSQGHCMTVGGGAGNGSPIEVTPCDGGPAQRFTLNNAHDLVNVSADKCVDVKDKETGNGTPLQLWTCMGTSNQKWHT
jgi:hypothetical protein